ADRPIRWRPDYALLRQVFRRAPRLVFHTEAERASLERDYRTPVRATVIRHEVAAVAPPVPREVARERLGFGGAADPVFVCAGFLQPSKGFDRAVRAFPAAGGGSLFVVGSVRDRTPENEAYAADLRASCGRTPGGTLYVVILISVVLAAVAQLTLKHGMNQVTALGGPLDLKAPLAVVRRAGANPSVIAGLAIFVLSAAFWLVVLSKASLSFAYPFV